VTGDISIAELARQVREVLGRFQSLADRLDTSYVTKEVFDLYQRGVDKTVGELEKDAANLERDKAEVLAFNDLARRVANIEDNQKWMVRLILGLIVVAIVGTVLITGGSK
jgi:predicted nuclease of restriction endonuclease-like RecB superfamily